MTYPETPGYRDTDTSRNAADYMTPHAMSMRRRVWEALRERPQTVYEIELRFGWLNQTASPRMSELKQMGLAEDTGVRRPAASGQDGAVIRAIDPDADYEAADRAWKKDRKSAKPDIISELRRYERAVEGFANSLAKQRMTRP